MKTFLTVATIGLATLGGFGCNSDDAEQERDARTERAHSFVTVAVDDQLDDLEVTDAQRTHVHEIKDRLFDKAVAMRPEGERMREEALAEWRKDTPDKEKLHAMVDTRVEAWRTMMHTVVDEAIDLHGTLTPEQRDKLATTIEEKMAERHRH